MIITVEYKKNKVYFFFFLFLLIYINLSGVSLPAHGDRFNKFSNFTDKEFPV